MIDNTLYHHFYSETPHLRLYKEKLDHSEGRVSQTLYLVDDTNFWNSKKAFSGFKTSIEHKISNSQNYKTLFFGLK